MKQDIEKINIEFHVAARELFFSLYSRFTNAVVLTSRQREENVFQLQHRRYVNALQSSLEILAGRFIDKYAFGRQGEILHRTLTGNVKEYLKEFSFKTGRL